MRKQDSQKHLPEEKLSEPTKKSKLWFHSQRIQPIYESKRAENEMRFSHLSSYPEKKKKKEEKLSMQ